MGLRMGAGCWRPRRTTASWMASARLTSGTFCLTHRRSPGRRTRDRRKAVTRTSESPAMAASGSRPAWSYAGRAGASVRPCTRGNHWIACGRPIELIVRDEMIGAPQSSLNGPMSGTRHFATVRLDLAEVKATKTRLGGTVNDVVLALCAGGLRHLLLSRGDALTEGNLRAQVPGEHPAGGQGARARQRADVIVHRAAGGRGGPDRPLRLHRRPRRAAQVRLATHRGQDDRRAG